MSKPTIIIIDESVVGSLIKDAGSFLLFFGLIGAGVAMDSAVMQTAGFFVAVVFSLSISLRSRTHLTVDQARARLDEIEGK